MSTYLIAEVTVKDAEQFKEYVSEVPKVLANHGGKYLVRGTDITMLEGDWNPKRMVVIEFPTKKAAMEFYDGAEYAPWKKVRQKYSDSKNIIVEGV